MMTARMSRRLGSAVVAAAALIAPLVSAVQTAPTSTLAQCPPGQTGVIYGCSPFCVEGKFLDTQTGLCMPITPPPPAPRY